jgi:hypothetical protein
MNVRTGQRRGEHMLDQLGTTVVVEHRLPILVQLLAPALIPLPRLRRAPAVAAEPDDRMLHLLVLRAFRRLGPAAEDRAPALVR